MKKNKTWGYYAEVQAMQRVGEEYDYDRHGPQRMWFDDPLPTSEKDEVNKNKPHQRYTEFSVVDPQAKVKTLIPNLNLAVPSQ